jgi:hypothetical protein
MQSRLSLPVLLATALATASGCWLPQSTAFVRLEPAPDGTYQIIARDFERDDAEMAANLAAHHQCEGEGRRAVFVHESSEYTGSLDENTRAMLRRTSQAVFATPIVLDHKHRSAGVTAAVLGNAMTDSRDYKAQVVFRCE